MEVIKETCYKGTRILLGNEKQEYLQKCREYLKSEGFIEIQIPIIQHAEIFAGKVGEENNNMMYTLTDRGGRDLCLAPEYTAVVQKLASSYFKDKKDVKLFYVAECFRGEKSQKGRYRQFTQLGVEILNPIKHHNVYLEKIAEVLVSGITTNYETNKDVTRGLDYYKEGKGFEISCEELGSSKQVCGGGEYEGGIGFAIGVDRIMEISREKRNEVN
jgi:histidyl-tRNA synthetase